MSRLKVAFVLPSLHGGGAERAAVTFLNALPQDRYALTLYLFRREGAYLADVGDHVRVVVATAGSRLGRFIALRRFCAAERFDVVVSFLSHFVVYSAVRAAGTATRFVISQQTPLSAFLSDADYEWRRPLRRRVFAAVARIIYPRADLIAATSEGVAGDLVRTYGVSRERVSIVHNPVDVTTVSRVSAEPIEHTLVAGSLPTVVMAGRLAHAKNLPLLVASFAALAKRLPFRAWILGQGELEADFRRRLEEASLTGRVQLLGFQSNPWKYMARADVFALTSHYEGFGNVLIEAMACGLPVVATASYGTREIVRDGETGFLIARHEPEDVAAALEKILADSALRSRLSVAARERANEFSVPVVTARFASVIDRLVAA